MNGPKALLFANTDWYLYNFRRSLVEAVAASGWRPVLVSPPGEYGPRLRGMGFDWRALPFSVGGTNPVAEAGLLRRLVALYRQERPALAHHFTIKCVLYGSLAARAAGGVRVVNAVTGLGHVFTDEGVKARGLRPVVRGLYRAALHREAGRVVFQNQEDLEAFVGAGLVPRHLTRLIRGSGVDCERFRPNGRSQGNGPVRILFASRLLREKGIYELLTAFRALRERGLDAQLIVAGDRYPGNPSSLDADEVEALTQTPDIEYRGHVEDMPALIGASDMVVLPSYREGTPRVLIEAAAMARPIVATDIAGCAGLVQDGVNGLTVPVRDVGALADAMARLAGDGDLRSAMGRRGREIVLAEFDERVVIRKTLDVYREITPA